MGLFLMLSRRVVVDVRLSNVMDQWDMGEGRWERDWYEGEQCDGSVGYGGR